MTGSSKRLLLSTNMDKLGLTEEWVTRLLGRSRLTQTLLLNEMLSELGVANEQNALFLANARLMIGNPMELLDRQIRSMGFNEVTKYTLRGMFFKGTPRRYAVHPHIELACKEVCFDKFLDLVEYVLTTEDSMSFKDLLRTIYEQSLIEDSLIEDIIDRLHAEHGLNEESGSAS